MDLLYQKKQVPLVWDAGKRTFRYRYMMSNTSLWDKTTHRQEWAGFKVDSVHWHGSCYSATGTCRWHLKMLVLLDHTWWFQWQLSFGVSPAVECARLRSMTGLARNAYQSKFKTLRMHGRDCVRLTVYGQRSEEGSYCKASTRDQELGQRLWWCRTPGL